MSKKTSKKNKKNEKKRKINFKLVGICAAALLLIVAVTSTCLIIRKKINDRTVRIAFYGLSDEIQTMLKEKIPQEEKVILRFDNLAERDFDAAVIKRKYDMLFTWRGEITDYLSESSEDIPQRILETIPRSLRNKKCIPILLDHCELAYRKDLIGNDTDNLPVSFRDFEGFLEYAKSKVFSPFFCSGAEDRILIDFLGALVQAKGGLASYNALIAELRQAETLQDILDKNLAGVTLREILDLLKSWPDQGYTHPDWYRGRGNDITYFAQSKQLAVFFTLLSEHRNISYNIVKDFESAKFGTDKNANNYGLIAPAVSAMLISNNSNCKRYLAEFFKEENQIYFSNKTMLAPVHYQAEAYDRQADDVRFWAASCAGGAVPDIFLAVYQRKTAALEKMAAEIRDYLKSL